MPYSPCSPAFLARLRELTAADRVVIEPDLLADYGHDESAEEPRLPEALVRAISVDEVAAVVQLCADARVPVTPSGLGTGLTGGSVLFCVWISKPVRC
ncbi:MAG: FAD-binding protein [bacterium]